VSKFACCLLLFDVVSDKAGKAGSVSQCENLGGGQKLANRSQPFLGQSLVEIRSVTVEIRRRKKKERRRKKERKKNNSGKI